MNIRLLCTNETRRVYGFCFDLCSFVQFNLHATTRDKVEAWLLLGQSVNWMGMPDRTPKVTLFI